MPEKYIIPILIDIHKINHPGPHKLASFINDQIIFLKGNIQKESRKIITACHRCNYQERIKKFNQESFFRTRLAHHNYRRCTTAAQIDILTINYIARHQKDKYPYLIVIICNYCGFTQAKPIKTNTSEEVSRALWDTLLPER